MQKRKITHIIPTELVGEKQIAKAWLVLEEVKEQHPNSLYVDIFGDKTEWLTNYNVWDIVEIEYNTKAREYNGKWYNSVSARQINKVNKETNVAPSYDDWELPF